MLRLKSLMWYDFGGSVNCRIVGMFHELESLEFPTSFLVQV